MPTPPASKAWTTDHPGSSEQDTKDESHWDAQHNHRIGFRNGQGRVTGFTHNGDHDDKDQEEQRFAEQAITKYRQLSKESKQGKLLNFQDIIGAQTDFHRRRPEVYPPGWRFMVRVREDWVKKEQNWPANQRQHEKEREKQRQQGGDGQQNGDAQSDRHPEGDHDAEHDWRRQQGREAPKHHDAYGKSKEDKQNEGSTANEATPRQTMNSDQKLRDKYTPEEITLLRHLQQQKHMEVSLLQNEGDHESPVKAVAEAISVAIDVVDAMTPDNWIPRSQSLIRRTGQHPLNAEPKLIELWEAGMITPNELHYVRNHGAVPRLFWDTHVLDVCDGALKLSMDGLKDKFDSINIAVALACDGNRRGELNLLKKSKGFDWGPGAVSCAYWKGARLYQVLLAAGVQRVDWNGRRRWVNFEGADEPSEGKYATCLPLDYALNPVNDVLLAYEMNNTPLPPDHGFPVRLLVPGYVGGRSIKWLGRIWISDHENDSHYHIWDNRVLPSFISEKDGEFARTMFHHPSTACNEQNLQSVIVRPGQGEQLDIAEVLKQETFRLEGYAYDGGGHEVQRVELSTDGGKTWLYCLRKFPERPIRNGTKFWTWLHWYIDIDASHLVRAESLTVRCFNVFKNTQPPEPVWNIMGMMNNGWYKVKLEPSHNHGGKLTFRHPYDQEGNGGWMTPSTENQLAAAKQSSGVPEKQFTRQEIEKHNSKDDCWLVINDVVYDASSALSWHPGGSAVLLANAGKLDMEVTSSFESVHDEYAHKKLQECAIGKVTDKAKNFMREKAKQDAVEAAKGGDDNIFLQSKAWVPVTLKHKQQLSDDTFCYTFAYRDYPANKQKQLGLETCQHIQFGIHTLDKLLIRSYTPTRPTEPNDDDGTFDVTIKVYFPDENQPGGAFSNFLHEMSVGEEVDVCGPTGEIIYRGNGRFEIEGKEKTYEKVSLVLGGSGVTPGFALVERIAREGGNVKVRIVDANKTEKDILMREALDECVESSGGRVRVKHVLSHPKDGEAWEKKGGLKGHVNEDIIKTELFEPEAGSVVFLCGPPAMIAKAALPALKDWGYKEDVNCFGF